MVQWGCVTYHVTRTLCFYPPVWLEHLSLHLSLLRFYPLVKVNWKYHLSSKSFGSPHPQATSLLMSSYGPWCLLVLTLGFHCLVLLCRRAPPPFPVQCVLSFTYWNIAQGREALISNRNGGTWREAVPGWFQDVCGCSGVPVYRAGGLWNCSNGRGEPCSPSLL